MVGERPFGLIGWAVMIVCLDGVVGDTEHVILGSSLGLYVYAS